MITYQSFQEWLNRLKNVWETRNPDGAINLCADKFLWFETPFLKPYSTKEQLLKEWETVLSQKDISVSYKILSISGNSCIAHWHATFIRIPSGIKAILDGIYQVDLDDQGKCVEFHQWYNSK